MVRVADACAAEGALRVSSRAIRLPLVLVGLFLAAESAPAQTTGSIEGRVTDSNGEALPGVTVSAASPTLQGTRTAVADRAGLFRFPAVPPGEYTVRADPPGFRSVEKAATVRLDGTANVEVVLEPRQTEEVHVSGAPTSIDPASTTTGTSYTSSVISRLPGSRNYADIVRANPGVSIDRGDADDRTLAVAIYGATSHENQWNVDGVSTTGVFKGTQAKKVAPEFIQEVEVKTGGYEAEYGGALGGVINVVTKAGGNEFHGDAFTYYDVWTSDPFVPEGDEVVEEDWRNESWHLDVGAGLGGYLWKDRLWFFGAFNLVEEQAVLSRFEPTTFVSTEDRFPSDSRETLYSGKLTWSAGRSTSVVGTVFADPMTHEGVTGDPPVDPDPSTWYSARHRGGTDFGVQLTQLFGARAIATVGGGYHKEKGYLDAPDAIRYEDWTCRGGTLEEWCIPPDEPNSITGGFGWVGGLAERPVSSRSQYRGQVTLYGGNHEIRAGGGYSSGRTDGFGTFTGGQVVTILNERGQTYYEHQYIARGWDDPTPVEGVNRGAGVRDFGAYLQDSWKAAPGLTINAGLRWDGEDVEDYKRDTVLRLRTAWQPRLGVVWDPWTDGKTKVFAFAGRFSYTMPTVGAAGAFGDATAMLTWNLDPVSLDPDPRVIGHEDGEPMAWFGGAPFGVAVDSEVASPYQDELTLGVERSLGPRLTVGLKGTYRRLGAAIETRCDLEPGPETNDSNCAIITPGSNGRFARGVATTCNGLWDDDSWYACESPGPATPEAKRVYRGLELSARQTIGDRLWLQASYVYSSLRGNYDGAVNEIQFEARPGFNSDFDYPAIWHNGYGILTLDRPHRFRLDGYWVTPWRLSVGLQAFVESGAPVNKMGYFNGGYGPVVYLVPRGSAGRLPTLWEANLTLGYSIPLGPVTATLQMDLFNVFDNQIPIATDEGWANRPPEGFPATIYDPNQEQSNEDYGSVTGRSDPRAFRAALRVSF
jgi:hypothetical protein